MSFSAPLSAYQQQAEALLEAHGAADPKAIRLFHESHPRFLDEKIPWLPKRIPDSEIQDAAITIEDAQLALARSYNFQDWSAVAEYAQAVTDPQSEIFQFESAVEAVINGDAAALAALLDRRPELVHARSTRRTCFDPPIHGATLLHYIGANGVENHRQKSPKNAVEIAALLLNKGADADALAKMYGGECTTMSMLVSSTPPAEAGVQVALIETLIAFGAAVEPHGSGNWESPVMTALVFGFADAAETLVRRGAQVTNIAIAAGLGRLAESIELLPSSDADSRHRALALAAQLGHTEVVRLLLDAGEEPNRYNPEGMHSHASPLHHAALGGHESVVRLLVERGASLELKDTIYQSTPLGWAEHGGQTAVAEFLRG